MYGDGVDDTFVFAAGHGNDTIKYFGFGDDEDLIDLSQITGITGFGDLTITAADGDAVIDLTAHGGGTIWLESGSVNDLDAEDFQFYEAATDSGVEGIRVAVPLRVITRILLSFYRLFREWLAEIHRLQRPRLDKRAGRA